MDLRAEVGFVFLLPLILRPNRALTASNGNLVRLGKILRQSASAVRPVQTRTRRLKIKSWPAVQGLDLISRPPAVRGHLPSSPSKKGSLATQAACPIHKLMFGFPGSDWAAQVSQSEKRTIQVIVYSKKEKS